jgi:hypothetical protein
MTTHYTIKTANGHIVDANCWQGCDLNFQVHIDGKLYTEGSSYIGNGDTAETEAKHQATQTAEDIDSGRLVEVGDGWKLAEEVA